MKEKFIPQDLIPDFDTPIEAKQKVLDYIYNDLPLQKNKKNLFSKIKVFHYASFVVILLIAFTSIFSINKQNSSDSDIIIYAQELNKLLQDSEPDLLQLISMVDEEDSLQF